MERLSEVAGAVVFGATFAVGACLGLGALYVVVYQVVRLLAWVDLKVQQREFRKRQEAQ